MNKRRNECWKEKKNERFTIHKAKILQDFKVISNIKNNRNIKFY